MLLTVLLPRADQPDYLWANNGTDFSAGVPSRYDLQLMHDAVVGKDGNIYFSDADSPERTVGKIDPETGRVTSYMLPDKDGVAVGTHGAAVAPDGNIWLTNQTERTMLQFDPRTEKLMLPANRHRRRPHSRSTRPPSAAQ